MFNKIAAIISFMFVTIFSTIAVAGAFVDNNNGTVTDLATGLIWQQSDNGTTINHSTAMYGCAALSLDGNANWRLPEIKELTSLVDYEDSEVSIDRLAFPNTQASFYWSASSRASSSASAWGVSFFNGSVFSSSKIGLNFVRCVR